MDRSNLSNTEKFKVLSIQGVGPMDLETLTEILQNKTEFSDQQTEFAFNQHIKGPFTDESKASALKLLEQHRPLVANEINRKKTEQLEQR